MYYAEYHRYYAFPAKAERDKWVAENEFEGANYVAAPVTRKVIERVMGKNFKVVANYYFDGLNVVLRANDC